jgi:hypothetical protein
MRRSETVAVINPARAMVGIATQDDGFTIIIIELLSGGISRLAIQSFWANGYGLGSEVYENLTKHSREEVYVQNHGVNQASLRQQLLF